MSTTVVTQWLCKHRVPFTTLLIYFLSFWLLAPYSVLIGSHKSPVSVVSETKKACDPPLQLRVSLSITRSLYTDHIDIWTILIQKPPPFKDQFKFKVIFKCRPSRYKDNFDNMNISIRSGDHWLQRKVRYSDYRN